MRTLVLHGVIVGTLGVRALVNAPSLARLTVLDLSSSAFGVGGVRALIASTQLDGLTRLDVRDCGIGRDAKKSLQERFGERAIVVAPRRRSAPPESSPHDAT